VRSNARNKLAAAAATCALVATTGMALTGPASASAGPARQSSAALRAALRGDLRRYLTARRTAEHISAVSLRVTFPSSRPAIALATGTTRYGGGPPVSPQALWEIGSNTRAFTSVIVLQLEAEGRLSIGDPIGRWLPQYPAWRHITIRQLLDTSRIPDYPYQPAFAANQHTRFTAAHLISYVAGGPPSLIGKAMPPLALTWAQAAGAIVSSLADLATWDRALYSGQLLPARQQHQLESLVSEATGKPMRRTAPGAPNGYGLGVQQENSRQTGPYWAYEGQAFGARVLNLYLPRTGMSIALAVNSSTITNDDLSDLSSSVYQTLQHTGAIPGS